MVSVLVCWLQVRLERFKYITLEELNESWIKDVPLKLAKQMNGKLKHIKRRRRPFIDGYWSEDTKTVVDQTPEPNTLYCWATLKWPKCEKDDSENGFQKGDCSISLYTGKSGNLKSRLTDCSKGFAKWQKIVLLADPVDEDEDENKQEQLNINALREAKNLNPSFVHCLNINL